MKEVFGEGWENIFDLMVNCAKKPKFWEEGRKFYSIDLNSKNLRKEISAPIGHSTGCEKYQFGNFNEIDSLLVDKFGKNMKGIYFGDSFSSDCRFTLSEKYKDRWNA